MDTRERIGAAQWILERNLGWIAAADIKAGVIIGINAALGGGLAAAYNEADSRTCFVIILSVLAAVLGMLSVFFSAMAVLPHTNGPKRSLVFFGCIAQLERSEYCEKFGAVSEEELLSDLTSQIHRNAEIACDKYGHLGKAMRLALCFSVVWAIALALLVKV